MMMISYNLISLKGPVQGGDMKVFISFDYEGIGGVASWTETSGCPEQDRLATEQVNAFCRGIRKSDPDAEILLCDSHAHGRNILWERLEPGITLVKGYPRNFYMMEGIDETFTSLVFFGYHSPVGGGGMMEHTYSGSAIYGIKVNGEDVDEGMINASLAGEYGVPLSFVYGDDITEQFLSPKAPGARFLVSKRAVSKFSGVMRPYRELVEGLEREGELLIKTRGSLLKLDLPGEMVIEFRDALQSYMCSVIPGTEPLHPRKIRIHFNDAKEMYRYLMTVIYICSGAKEIR
jgi:D-amino peptidase